MVAKTPNVAPWHRCSHKQLFIYKKNLGVHQGPRTLCGTTASPAHEYRGENKKKNCPNVCKFHWMREQALSLAGGTRWPACQWGNKLMEAN